MWFLLYIHLFCSSSPWSWTPRNWSFLQSWCQILCVWQCGMFVIRLILFCQSSHGLWMDYFPRKLLTGTPYLTVVREVTEQWKSAKKTIWKTQSKFFAHVWKDREILTFNRKFKVKKEVEEYRHWERKGTSLTRSTKEQAKWRNTIMTSYWHCT